MKKATLLDKLNDPEFFSLLSSKSKKQLLICEKLLTKEELNSISSINVGYYKARSRYIEQVYGRDKISEYYKVPLREMYIALNINI